MRSVCLGVGMARLRQGRLAAALQWLGRSGDAAALSQAAAGIERQITEHAAAWPAEPPSSSGAADAVSAFLLLDFETTFKGEVQLGNSIKNVSIYKVSSNCSQGTF